MGILLTQEFFNRDVKEVAKDLIGKYLLVKREGQVIALQINETEAYDGEKDLACHASKGRTSRTEVLYGEPGQLYVYLCYGIYYMLNVVTREKDYPSAVLIRGAGGFDGPGKLTKALGVTKILHGRYSGKDAGLWFEDWGEAIPDNKIKKTPRIGVDYAGPLWSKKKYRFISREKGKRNL